MNDDTQKRFRPVLPIPPPAALRVLALLGLAAVLALCGRVTDAEAQTPEHSVGALYDAGNEAFREGRLGEAIVAYERALLIEPRASDVRANLALARERAGLTDPSPSVVTELAPREWAWTLGGSLAVLTLFLAIWSVRGRREWWTVAPAALALGGVLFGAWGLFERGDLERRAIVVDSETAARVSPIDEAEVVFDLPEGASVRLLDAHGTWVRIRASEGEGWVDATRVTSVVPPTG